MRRARILLGLFSVCSATFLAAAAASADEPQLPKPLPEHAWLKQFVGEWNSEMEAIIAPDQPPMRCKGTMKARLLGDFWVVSEMKSEMMGTPMQGLLTVGYDPESKKYVGTWVDSMTNHLWNYRGSVDEGGKVLTLEADGPSFTEPGKTVKYRDVYEFKSADEVAISSAAQGPDGNWFTFMRGTSKRKK